MACSLTYNYSGVTTGIGVESVVGAGVGAGVCIFSGTFAASGFARTAGFGAGVASLFGVGYYFAASLFV